MDQESFQLPVAPYPAPPPFWKHFTAENLERMKEVGSCAQLPFELSFLRPPPPPAHHAESYKTFSVPWKLDPIPALPSSEILLFEPNHAAFEHAQMLKRLTNSLLLNFLELTTVLSNDPVKYEEKLQDIERLMLNVHCVINLYRPHQAREGIKEIMQDRLDAGKAEVERCDDMKQKIEQFLRDLEKEKPESKAVEQHPDGELNAKECTDLWTMIHNLKDD